MTSRLGFFLGLASMTLVSCQRFPDRPVNYDTTGLSAACAQVLNTTVQCSQVLYDKMPEFDVGGVVAEVMSDQEVNAVCVDTCKASLVDLRNKIKQACGPNDKMKHDGYAFPSTYIADILLFAYTSSCYKDKVTGKFCDVALVEWREDESVNHDCEDCILGPIKVQIEHAVAYDESVEQDFKSMTASCKATGYDYTVPAQYASPYSTTATTTTKPAPTRPCPTPYTIAEGDTCDLISQKRNVSTFGLIDQNNLMMPCQLRAAGTSICLPYTCKTHFMYMGETCADLQERYGVTRAQLVSWNPNFDYQCINAQRWRYTYVCVGPVGGATSPTTTAVPTATPAPTSAAPNSNRRCAAWHTIVATDYCVKLANDNGISLDEFLFLNPDLDAGCTKLQLGTSYCVKPVGDITTYPGYPKQEPSTIFTRPTVSFELPVPTTLPHAPGTHAGCAVYANYKDFSLSIKEYGMIPNLDLVNRCTSVTVKHHVLLDNLLKWNPSLDPKDCRLAFGYSYCVNKDAAGTTTTGSTIPPTSTTTTKASTTSSSGPSPTQAGIIKTCSKFYKAVAKDTCQGIVDANYPISLADFYKWNPAVKTGCTGLWEGYHYCVGVPIAFRLKTLYRTDCSSRCI